MTTRTISNALLALMAVAIGLPPTASAVTMCSAKIQSKTGILEIKASGVGTNPVWGVESGVTTQTFPDEATCFVPGTLSKCHLGAPGTLAEKTPGPECKLCINDDSATECCVSHIKGCTPGLRLGDGSFPPGDPRLTGVSLLGSLVQVVGGTTVRFEGVNVQIVDGSGDTAGATNGLGNLLIGYDEDDGGDTKTGSHNLVLGRDHSYTSYGGLVGGRNNTISGAHASVLAGNSNTASGANAGVAGGLANDASGTNASVCGGQGNEASGPEATVSGGRLNDATGDNASVSGGFTNTASNTNASVSGGELNIASGIASSVTGGLTNDASGDHASVTGGELNLAIGTEATVNGGDRNEARDDNASVAGGQCNVAGGGAAPPVGCLVVAGRQSVGGGYRNHASGGRATVSAGYGNTATNTESAVCGGQFNDATGPSASVSGGYRNEASGTQAAVSGGTSNEASAIVSSVTGGQANTASAFAATVGGGFGVTASVANEWHADRAAGYPTATEY